MLVAGVLAALFVVCGSIQQDALALSAGSPAPDLSLPKLNGAPFNVSSLKGKPYILTFFTTWSDSCIDNLKFLSSLNKDTKGIGIVTVSLDKDPELVGSFLKKNGIDLLTLIDSRKTSIKDFRILIIPVTFVIDQYGTVDKVYVDYDEAVRESIADDVKRLLSQKN